MSVNVKKTPKIIVFRKGGYLWKREKWFYEGEAIEAVNNYTYLGYTFTTMLSAKLGTNHLVTKGGGGGGGGGRQCMICAELIRNVPKHLFQDIWFKSTVDIFVFIKNMGVVAVTQY